MFTTFIVIIGALLVLLWWRAIDGALHVLSVQGGRPYDERRADRTSLGVLLTVILVCVIVLWPMPDRNVLASIPAPAPAVEARYTADSLWIGPDTASIGSLSPEKAALVRYGRALIANTAAYLGPQGSVDHRTNGMNCTNCHLEAGTKPWGNNYGAVRSQYPKFRERSGTLESVAKRVNDCVERSLNGRALDTTGHEMQAIIAYLDWVGTGVPAGTKPKGTGIRELAYLDRAADPARGERVFSGKCMTCHDADGQGRKNADGATYMYPPLWGPNSFNVGAGLLRLSRLAGYVHANMPQGTTWDRPQLSEEEAWDVAAYIASQQRPPRDLSADWPKLTSKPVDHPFGPYADGFNEQQHKYGPFGPIAAAKKKAAPSPTTSFSSK